MYILICIPKFIWCIQRKTWSWRIWRRIWNCLYWHKLVSKNIRCGWASSFICTFINKCFVYERTVCNYLCSYMWNVEFICCLDYTLNILDVFCSIDNFYSVFYFFIFFRILFPFDNLFIISIRKKVLLWSWMELMCFAEYLNVQFVPLIMSKLCMSSFTDLLSGTNSDTNIPVPNQSLWMAK